MNAYVEDIKISKRGANEVGGMPTKNRKGGQHAAANRMDSEANEDGFYPVVDEADGAQKKTAAGERIGRHKGRNGVEQQTS